jgi:hypothetical protein
METRELSATQQEEMEESSESEEEDMEVDTEQERYEEIFRYEILHDMKYGPFMF